MYIKRKIEYQIQANIKSNEIIAIVGPRQCGKTTLIKHISDELNNTNFISFDDLKALQMFNEDIDTFIDTYVKNNRYLFIDEFQYAKEGGKKLKYIYDSNHIKIFISGSSAIDLTIHAVKYLVGRVFIFNLYQFDFEEFLEFRKPEFVLLLNKQRNNFYLFQDSIIPDPLHSEFVSLYEEYVLFGGYPRVVLSNNVQEKKEILKNIYNTYFLREVKDILGLIDDYKLSKLIQCLSLQIGNLIDYHGLCVASEFSYRQLKKYINFLEKTFICSFVRPYYRNKTLEIVKNPKVYFFDTGIRNIIIDDFRKLSDRQDGGFLLENSVFEQLLKDGKDIKYWRTKQKQEVDFIIENENKKLIALEVKSSSDIQDVENLNKFKDKYAGSQNILLYLNSKERQDKYKLLSDIKKYPIYSL